VKPEEISASPGWTDAAVAASLLAVDPNCGAALRSLAGPVRDRWLALLRQLMPATAPIRRIPLQISDGRLLGGLDLAATLRARRPVADRGLLVEADGGLVLLAMAERISATTAAHVTGVLDTQLVLLERDGLTLRTPLRVGVVALDEGIGDDERLPSTLLDRLAFQINLDNIRVNETFGQWHDADEIAAARARLGEVQASEEVLQSLCQTALALGIDSIRASLLALRVARAAAALDGRSDVSRDDATLAARLVLAPRATRMPASEPPESEDDADTPDDEQENDDSPPPPPESEDKSGEDENEKPAEVEGNLDDVVLAAAQAAIPAGLLAQLKAAGDRSSRAPSAGRAGVMKNSRLRGRPAGVRRGQPRAGSKLNVVETLRAAAPWQRLRKQETAALHGPDANAKRIEVRLDDFHVSRYRQRTETTTVFVVDASGSSALHRLAEAKGAVELLLAESYVRRDRVAVVGFRGRSAEILLPPTRSLVRAKRSLAALPGGGGTPLASGIDAATAMVDAIRRHGGTPTVVLLTDGRANIARDGGPGRARAHEDALAAARLLRVMGISALLVDTSPHAHHLAQHLATEMGARYLALPYADAKTLSGAVKASALVDSRSQKSAA
jgi:magnesium chelatase subunit D